MKKNTIKAGIVGSSGYSARELVEILKDHPQAEIAYCASRAHSSKTLGDVHPRFRGLDISLQAFDPAAMAQVCDVVFLAVPHGAAMEAAVPLLEHNVRVIDISADFRLQDPAEYKEWYEHEHMAQRQLKDAVYGLPEFAADAIQTAALVANPGCYATAALLGILPVAAKQIGLQGPIYIDAKSGYSGAGRNPKGEDYNFCEAAENIRPYKVAKHRHIAEISQIVQQASKKDYKICFVPHVIPMKRGILANIYFSLRKALSYEEAHALFKEAYEKTPFVRLLPDGEVPETKHVENTNYCDIGIVVHKKTSSLIIMTVIDNLVKGAAGQAVQNMNIMFGIEETAGLV